MHLVFNKGYEMKSCQNKVGHVKLIENLDKRIFCWIAEKLLLF